VLWALGLERSVAFVADTASDEVGQALERAHLPKRVTGRKEQLDDDF